MDGDVRTIDCNVRALHRDVCTLTRNV
jgi:hypothetical protein